MSTFIQRLLLGLVLTLLIAPSASAEPMASNKAMIKDALKAGPAEITDNATIMDMAGNLLREGDNGWICYPGKELDQGKDAMCVDDVWNRLVQAWINKQPFSTDRIGISYMYGGDGVGVSNIDPFATSPTDDNQWVAEGPHLMIVVPNAEMLEGMTTDPDNGGPYVMWKGTPYAHIMIPLGKR